MAQDRLVRIPPQHGAWAYLLIPLVVGWVDLGVTWVTVVFGVAWVAAYPVSYYVGRAIAARVNRGWWTARAKRELGYAVPWMVLAGVFAVVLVVARPWVIVAAIALIALWLVSVLLTVRGYERGIANDLLLIVMAATAVPLVWALTVNDPSPAAIPHEVWLTAFVLLVYFVGSVVHVKSLIREAKDPRWHVANVTFHVLALGLALISPWLLIAFVPALARSVVMKPGLTPKAIGIGEIVMSVLLIVACALGLPAG